jgi:uncharacterized protein (TIGR00251 family)
MEAARRPAKASTERGRFSMLDAMSSPTSFIRAEPDGVTLFVKAQPRANTNEVVGVLGPELRIKITAPPVDSAANEALVRFLAETLGLAKSQVQLVRGATARHKAVKIFGLTEAEVKQRLGVE